MAFRSVQPGSPFYPTCSSMGGGGIRSTVLFPGASPGLTGNGALDSFSTVRSCICLPCSDLQIRKPRVAPQIDFLGAAGADGSYSVICCTVGGRLRRRFEKLGRPCSRVRCVTSSAWNLARPLAEARGIISPATRCHQCLGLHQHFVSTCKKRCTDESQVPSWVTTGNLQKV
jgi:hypothetical protein